MFCKTIFSMGFFILIIIALSCHDSDNPTKVDEPDDTTTVDDPDDPGDDQEWLGTLRLAIKDSDKSVKLSGTFYNGPSPSIKSYDTVMTDGDCMLIKHTTNFCEENCGIDYVCAEGGNCQKKPDEINVGDITIRGLQSTDASSNFTVSASFNYQTPLEFVYPPFNDGDNINISVAGTPEIDSFKLSAEGFDLLNLHNNEILYEDNKPIKLTWDPPDHDRNTFIYVEIDISYHGGTKAQIVCVTKDDGELTIPADMLDKLKTYGIYGFPRMIVYRRTVTKVKGFSFIMENEVERALTIPGVYSCGNDEPCPDGYECNHSTKRCDKID